MATDEQNRPDIGGMLNGILSNPQALSSIMSVIGSMRDNMPTEQKQPPPSHEAYAPENTAEVNTAPPSLPAMSSQSFIPHNEAVPPYISSSRHQSREQALLVALKPFLSSRKCETIDTFLRLLDIFSLLGRIK